MIGLILSALWGRLRAILAPVGQWAAKCPLCAVCLALAILAGVQTWRVRTIEQKLIVARAQIAAGQANVANLRAQKAAIEAKQAAHTQRIDHATQPARKAALAGADAYARNNRVQCPTQVAASGQPSGNLPGPAPDPERAENPAPAPDMVAISRADLDACTLNSADLGLAYAWAQGLAP